MKKNDMRSLLGIMRNHISLLKEDDGQMPDQQNQDDTENKIAFTETITENNGRPVTIFYKGDLSAARSCIKGKWGTDENCTDGGDFMITIFSDEKLTIKLQLHN